MKIGLLIARLPETHIPRLQTSKHIVLCLVNYPVLGFCRTFSSCLSALAMLLVFQGYVFQGCQCNLSFKVGNVTCLSRLAMSNSKLETSACVAITSCVYLRHTHRISVERFIAPVGTSTFKKIFIKGRDRCARCQNSMSFLPHTTSCTDLSFYFDNIYSRKTSLL